jgi:signal transduction histidine kinase/CheY-like chemotaxis protein
MYFAHQILRKDSRGIIDASEELLLSTARKLMVVIGIVFFGVWMIAGMSDIGEQYTYYLSLLLLMGLLTATALAWVQYRLFTALVVWLAGLFLVVTVAVFFFPGSVFTYFYLPLPFIAVLLINGAAGVYMAGLILGGMVCFSWLNLIPFLSFNSLGILMLSSLLGILGWASFDSFNNATVWASYYFHKAVENLEEARQKQLDLFEIQDDLLRANQELSRLTERLKVLQLLADEARLAKVQFVANVSHELRAPLNMIIGYSELITRSTNPYGRRLPAPLLADITTIQRNAQHLSRLVDDVLDLSQIETDRMSLSKESCSFKQIVEMAVEVVRPLYDSKNLYLKTSIPEGLPAILCDPIRIRQIIINLLSNSGRFTQQGGVEIVVEQIGEEIVCHVADTGAGISKENQVRLFEPFQQADPSIRREHGGSGLGLNISKQFIEMHNGKIWMESEEGKGTTISFSLPLPTLVNVGRASFGANRWVSAYSVRDPRRRPFRAALMKPLPSYVLVETGDTLKRIFSRFPEEVDVISYSNPADAIKEISIAPAQAVIINTPSVLSPSEMMRLANQFNELPYETPVITCWLPSQQDTGHSLGVVDYINKPIKIESLLESIGKVEKPVRSILLVDDEESVLQLMMRILLSAPAGYRVWRASSGDMALEMMRNRMPDLVLLDIVLPGKDGWQILSEKNSDDTIRDIPVIIVSSRDLALENVTANILVVNRKSGLSAREFTDFIQAVSTILTPHPHMTQSGL